MVYLFPITVVGNMGEVFEKHVPYAGEPEMQGGPHEKTMLQRRKDV